MYSAPRERAESATTEVTPPSTPTGNIRQSNDPMGAVEGDESVALPCDGQAHNRVSQTRPGLRSGNRRGESRPRILGVLLAV